MKKYLLVFLMVFVAGVVLAQETTKPLAALTAGAVLRTEVSRTPDAEFYYTGKPAKAWKNWTPGAWTFLKREGLVSYYRNSVNDVRFDATTFINAATALYKEHHILEQVGQRPLGPLQPGQTWEARMRYVANPVNWCSDLETTLTGDFEVQATEPYTVKIDDQEVTLQVNPVIRRGTWQRCYRGPQTQRLIWSPELGVLLSVELLTYSPDSKLDPYSYVMRVTSIDRGSKEGGPQ